MDKGGNPASVIISVLLILTALVLTVWAKPIDINRFDHIDIAKTENRQAKDNRTCWWRQAKFGMFIHWGLYAVPAGQWNGEVTTSYSEWLMFSKQIPVAEYEKLADQFNPVRFDADQWVALAKQAGMKYMVITAKHHDGFAMYDSKVNNYDIVDSTPFSRDPIDELSKACEKAGIKFGCYYSIDRDWHHRHAQGNELKQTNFWDYPHESKRNFEKYLYKSALPQVEEILTNYDPAIIWFDGIDKKTVAQNEQILRMVRALRPDCLINSRLGNWKTYVWGDYRSMGDNRVSNRDLGYGWENPGTINRTYGYNKHDREWKSHTDIIHMLADITSNGGNYLLNVGPTAQGKIPAESVRVLQEVGKWTQRFGDSIYRTHPVDIQQPKWGRITAKNNNIYLHVFEWPRDDVLVVGGIKQNVREAFLLADPSKKKIRIERIVETKIKMHLDTINMNPDALDPSDTVIVLRLEQGSN